MPVLAALLLALQQPAPPTPPVPPAAAESLGSARSHTSPPAGDTVGYWQQRVHYYIAASLDEGSGVLHATGTLAYVNISPDTLREFYVHQYLNAFRPGSRWSATDAREGRVRFQHLRDPDYAYERFTTPPRFGGVAVAPEYPLAPDSTVARFRLPRPLSPGDSLRVDLAWDARLSTVPRRQGRRGRTFDFAQWYPKVAVYDRGGWQPNALVPAGEFYGEFGTYDVTVVVRDDQVLGATGVPVSGDPGWERVRRWGAVPQTANAYEDVTAPAALKPALPAVPPGFKEVRFFAHDVHHFGWSASPDYRYEGGVYVREAPARPERFRVWDTVAVHVLYKPGDEAEWGNGRAVERVRFALGWLEKVYGPYAYPQMTALHRIERGGTEFPMLMMNGSGSQGLILHEGGHVYTYGILANNEWQSGWMDEGLTSYQTSWASGATRPDRPREVPPAPRLDSAGRLILTALDSTSLRETRRVMLGLAQPIGLPGHEFANSATYSAMIYTRAELMYGALRDAMGDSAFTRFLHDYYDRWALRHVDERAMRAAAERAAGRDLGWFFDQWVHRVGTIDYALRDVRWRRERDGWVTQAQLVKLGAYAHPMPVGVLTAGGWTVTRGDVVAQRQELVVRTAQEPIEVRLDPFATTEDWFAPNYVFPKSRRPAVAPRPSPLASPARTTRAARAAAGT